MASPEDTMKTRSSWVLLSLFVFLAGCTSVRTGGEVQYGRQALLEGRSEAALGYFYSAAQMDPITYTGLAALQRKVIGAMSGGQSILPAEFPRHDKPWNGRSPPINPKISRGCI